MTEGATYLAERGVIPSASVWMPFGKPVMGSMKPPALDYYRRAKDMLGELYVKYNLEPAGCCGSDAPPARHSLPLGFESTSPEIIFRHRHKAMPEFGYGVRKDGFAFLIDGFELSKTSCLFNCLYSEVSLRSLHRYRSPCFRSAWGRPLH